jgi:hypothetical protein
MIDLQKNIIKFFALITLIGTLFLTFYSEEEETVLLNAIFGQLLLYIVIQTYGNKKYHWKWYDPPSTVCLSYTLFFSGGIFLYLFRQWVGLYLHPGNMILASKIGLIGFIFLITSLLIINYIKHPHILLEMNSELSGWSVGKLKIMVILLIFIGYIGAFLFTEGFRIIPILGGSFSQVDRYTLQEDIGTGKGLAFMLMTFHFFAIGFEYVRNKILKRTQLRTIMVFIICLPSLLMYSGRSFLLIPLLLLVLLSFYTKTNIRITKVLPFLFIFPIMWFMMLMYRSFGEFTFDTDIYFIFTDLLVEMRTFAVVLDIIKETNLFGLIIITSIAQTIPSFVFSVFGLDKAEYFAPIGKYLQSFIPEFGVNLGIRTSLFGECYLAGGYYVLFIIMLIIAYISIVTCNNLKMRSFTPKKFSYVLMGVYLPILIPYGTSMLITMLQMFIICIIFTKLVSK